MKIKLLKPPPELLAFDETVPLEDAATLAMTMLSAVCFRSCAIKKRVVTGKRRVWILLCLSSLPLSLEAARA